ncbi:MAG: hypothetical protein V3W31_07940 [Thermodesulfobacteriota bacterium]
MAAPTYSWNSITAGQCDADSPLDETLMEAIRQNLIHIEEWLGDGYTAAKDHDHDNVNSKSVVLGDGVVVQAKLSTTTGSVSKTVSNSNYGQSGILPGGEYGFTPVFKGSNTDIAHRGFYDDNLSTSYTATGCRFYGNGSSGTGYAQQRYVQASPPYMIGNVRWGHFLFVLRNVSTGEIVSAYEAEDPPWAYNGAVWLPKDDKGRIEAVPHPFADYWSKDPSTDGLEICLVDLRDYDTAKWRADNLKQGKGILEDLQGNVSPGDERSHASLQIPETPGFTDRVKIRARV